MAKPKQPKTQDRARVEIQYWPIDRFVNYARNPRKNDHVVDKIVASLREFGFTIPILAKGDGTVIDGHLRLKGARQLGLTEAPVIVCDHWTEPQVKAFRLLANRSVTWADWDNDLLSLELSELDADFADLEGVTGFDLSEIERLLLGSDAAIGEEAIEPAAEDIIIEKFEVLVSCKDERQQASALDLLQSRGFDCRALIA